MSTTDFGRSRNPLRVIIPVLFGIAFIVILLANCLLVVDAGHVAVATLFGKVQAEPYKEGFHVVNPLYDFTHYDARQKTHFETAQVPSQDQLQTSIDVASLAPNAEITVYPWKEPPELKARTIERVRKFILTPEPFTTENEMMTPSMKIRRHKIKERYADRLNALYRG